MACIQKTLFFSAKKGIVRKDSKAVGPESDFSIQLDLGGDVELSPTGFYG